ncbi:ABC transporter ATP-binding protein [Mollicutes bacterium LVI A0078]|nr:ABC transporter ATP-binding protein [Mollicutes bacterium LVI A0075]WOO91544.1 ABC transporter ATP-binding protein [Mollicutes bacterium LVI A0078]
MVFNVENVSLEIDQKKILSNVNASFEEGKFNAIIGPNGCGKSSLIKLFAKINKQTSGQITFYNQVLEDVKRKDFAKQVAFFFQFNDNSSEITVKQMVSYGRSAHKKLYQSLDNSDFEIIEDAIKKCDLENFVDRDMSSLSGGERQRVYLAMTIAQKPEIIVLDEPTNHLDIKYQFQLLSLIRNIMDDNDLTIICILHDFNQVLKYADNTLILSEGEVYDSGVTHEVITVKSVKEVFGIDSIIHSDGNGYHIDFIV